MSTKLRVLVIEDCSDDALLIERELRQAGFDPLIRRLETAQELRQAFALPQWDMVIADYAMPHFDGLSALKIVREYDEALPFILISGKIGEETAVEVLKAGAHNYIMKDRIKLLGPAVIQALHDAACQRQTRKLDNRNRTLARAVEQCPVSILITDTGGVIQHANPKLCSLTGYSPEELIGQNPRMFQSGKTSLDQYRNLWTTLIEGRGWQGTFCNRKKDGSLFWEVATIAPVRDDQGSVIQYVAVKEDISERIRLEQELQRARQDAECANQAKMRFLNIMSHELRTPLNAILGTLQLSELDQAYDPEMTVHAKTALFSMLDMIDTILEASRVESAEQEFVVSILNLELLLASLSRFFSVAARNKGLSLRMSLSDDLPRQVQIDGGHLKQILVYLLNNAIKFSEQGSIVLQMSRDVSSRSGLPLLQIVVQDTGIGIDPDKQKIVFDLFTQADDSNTRSYGGIGLGLALTKRLAELMGGTISLQSEVGKGSTFTVRLPLLPAT